MRSSKFLKDLIGSARVDIPNPSLICRITRLRLSPHGRAPGSCQEGLPSIVLPVESKGLIEGRPP